MYKQLTLEQRYILYTLKQEKFSQREIAKRLSVNVSTVSRELRRNSGGNGYHPKQAHHLAMNRRVKCRKPSKLTSENIRVINRYLRMDWSPEQISGFMKKSGEFEISHETIYKHIWLNKANGGYLYKHLRIKYRNRCKKYGTGKRVVIPNKKSIDERPSIVEERSRIGDWELDTIMPGRGGKHILVTMVERRSRYTRIEKITSKDACATARGIIRALSSVKGKVFTLTSDNGCEFFCHKLISKAIGAEYYFAHPYKAWERGLNENTNGLIRQYFPKKTIFEHLTRKDLVKVTNRLNNRPRKSLGYKTPKEYFYSLSLD